MTCWLDLIVSYLNSLITVYKPSFAANLHGMFMFLLYGIFEQLQ